MNRPFWTSPPSSLSGCDALAPLLPLYADGHASGAEIRRVEAHLPLCADCRAALAWMQATHAALAARPVAVPPPDLHGRIAQAIAESSRSAAPLSLRPARAFSLRPLYAAAASLTALGVALCYPLWHGGGRGGVVPAAPPNIASAPAAKTPAAPKKAVRPRAAARIASLAAKHKAPPLAAASPPERVAAKDVPAAVPAVPKAPPRRIAPPKQLASSGLTPEKPLPARPDNAPGLKHSAPKLPVPKAAAPKPIMPKLPAAPLIAAVPKEPPPAVQVHIQPPTVTQEAPVRTASVHVPAKPEGLLDSVNAHAAQMRTASYVPVKVSRDISHGAATMIQTFGSDQPAAILSAVHSDR